MVTYCHNKNPSTLHGDTKRGTFAFELPTKEYLEEMFLKHANAGMLKAGHSRVSKFDPFVKKTGRELAESRLDWTKFIIEDIQVHGIKHVWHCSMALPTKNQNSNNYLDTVKFALGTVAESGRVNLLYAFFN